MSCLVSVAVSRWQRHRVTESGSREDGRCCAYQQRCCCAGCAPARVGTGSGPPEQPEADGAAVAADEQGLGGSRGEGQAL